MKKPLLKVKNLVKSFPIRAGILRKQVGEVQAVRSIDFTIHEGEVFGMVGESGSGKSTAARCAIRLIEPTSGEITIFGDDLLTKSKDELLEVRKTVQMVFQDPYSSLNPRKRIADTIGEALSYHHLVQSDEEQEERVDAALEEVGLAPEAKNRYPHEFSGGQQQRICIARALIMQPKLLICDEAVSALDVSVQAQVLNLLMALKEKFALSYLFIAHNLSVVRHICDTVVVLYLGKVMEQADTEELFSNPKHPYTQFLLSSTPKSHPSEKSEKKILKGELPSPIHPPLGCPFRTRCPYAQPLCNEPPPKKKFIDKHGKEHIYYCILD